VEERGELQMRIESGSRALLKIQMPRMAAACVRYAEVIAQKKSFNINCRIGELRFRRSE
jgi:hypothetical protein